MFKNKKIKNLSDQEIIKKINNAITIVEDLTGFSIEVPKITIRLFHNSNTSLGHYIRGYYNDSMIKIIEINEKIRNKKLMRTISHELSHAYQDNKNLIAQTHSDNQFYLNKIQSNWSNGVDEAFAYFNGSYAFFIDQQNAYKKRASMINYLFSDIFSIHNFFDVFLWLKNLDFKTNFEDNKSYFNLISFNSNNTPIVSNLFNQSFISSDLGRSIALISFAANDFSILKTSESLFKPWGNILHDLNIKLNNKEQFEKIEMRMKKIFNLKAIFFKKNLANFIRNEINEQQNPN